MDNAVDSAADIYLDVVNLFVRILSITGKRRN
jgi:FtsH-binding integral membrane protein